MSDEGTVTKINVKNVNDTTQTNISDTSKTTTVSFSQDLQPILDAECVRCHGKGSNFDCTASASYNTIVNGGFVDSNDPENSKFFKVKSLPGHPDDYLLPEEHDLFVTWMKEGAKNN